SVAVHRDDHRDRQALLHLLGLRIELLAELHDVHALLTERRPDRGRRVGGARGHLQLDVALYLLSHSSLLGCKRLLGSPTLVGENRRDDFRKTLHISPRARERPLPAMPSPLARSPAPRASSARGSAPPPAGGSSRN